MTCHAQRLRCPICSNPDWHARAFGEECTHCGLRVDGPEGLQSAAATIPLRLVAGRARCEAADPWSLDALGWRNAAWRLGFVLEGSAAIRAEQRPHDVTLAVITCPAQADMAAALVSDLAFASTLVAIDSDDAAPWRSRFPGATVIAHPLAGDFAAQRNRLQALAMGWVIQLDSDERPDATLLASLGWLTAAADREGLASLGVARRNLVGGLQSALFPDIQYRLNRAEVRFAGVVHEQPVVPFERTSLALAGAIEHRLDAARVRERTQVYATMSADGARREDEARLLRPFDAIADR